MPAALSTDAPHMDIWGKTPMARAYMNMKRLARARATAPTHTGQARRKTGAYSSVRSRRPRKAMLMLGSFQIRRSGGAAFHDMRLTGRDHLGTNPPAAPTSPRCPRAMPGRRRIQSISNDNGPSRALARAPAEWTAPLPHGIIENRGGLGEWFNPADLKSADLQGSGGSNPSPSAKSVAKPLNSMREGAIRVAPDCYGEGPGPAGGPR